MPLLDSNIVIYAITPAGAAIQQFVRANDTGVSAVTRVEVLGYPQLTQQAETDLADFFVHVDVLPVTDDVIERAIVLRLQRRMSLGDALIAATALVHQLPLVTRNLSDFRWIAGLTVLDPFAAP